MHYLTLDFSETSDGTATVEFMASTRAEQHAAVMAEVQQVLDWARHHWPDAPGPLDEGGAWDHDLQVVEEDGGWHAVTLTLSASPTLIEALLAAFAPADD